MKGNEKIENQMHQPEAGFWNEVRETTSGRVCGT
jgi:hypothetical protein